VVARPEIKRTCIHRTGAESNSEGKDQTLSHTFPRRCAEVKLLLPASTFLDRSRSNRSCRLLARCWFVLDHRQIIGHEAGYTVNDCPRLSGVLKPMTGASFPSSTHVLLQCCQSVGHFAPPCASIHLLSQCTARIDGQWSSITLHNPSSLAALGLVRIASFVFTTMLAHSCSRPCWPKWRRHTRGCDRHIRLPLSSPKLARVHQNHIFQTIGQ